MTEVQEIDDYDAYLEQCEQEFQELASQLRTVIENFIDRNGDRYGQLSSSLDYVLGLVEKQYQRTNNPGVIITLADLLTVNVDGSNELVTVDQHENIYADFIDYLVGELEKLGFNSQVLNYRDDPNMPYFLEIFLKSRYTKA